MMREERIENLVLSTQNMIRGWRSYFHKALKPEKLSPTLMIMLFHIGANQPVSGRNIGVELSLSPSAVSQLIDGLSTLGYITRETRPEDRRVTYFGLTRSGQQKLADLDAKRNRFFVNVTAALTDEEMDTLVHLQQKIIDEIKKQSAEVKEKEVV